jgi:pyruvate formate lyase activating enzyme
MIGEDALPANFNEDGERLGAVLHVERSSIHDGDVFRTVIFLMGCPLRCRWCSTPESQSSAIERIGDKTYGEAMSVNQLMTVVRKDSIFYFHSGGGLTLSGGEPLVQADFCEELLRQARHEGIGTAIETSLAAPFRQVEKLLHHLDIIYADIKHIDSDAHRKYCGKSNADILDNLRRVDARAKGLKLVVRIPLIPGINDDNDTLHGIGTFCADLSNLHCVQLLPYHRFGVDTYRKLGIDYSLASLRPPTEERMEACREIVRSHVGGGAC